MKNLLFSLLTSATTAAAATTSTPKGWTDDYDAALKQAAAEKKLVLVDFSGSDWCGWCKKLDKEVFAKEEFLKVATNSYVLLMIDSPSDDKLLSAKAKEQNPKLVEKYGVRGFPTVLLLDAKGEVVAKTGYQKGGPAKYLEKLKALSSQADDPEFNNVVKPLKAKLEKTAKDFRAVTMKEYAGIVEKHLPELRKAVEDAKAVKVSEKNKAAADESIKELEGTISQIEEMLRHMRGEAGGDMD